MEEINHFGHEEHSLKLIESWETVADDDDDDDEKKGVVKCDGCLEPISIISGDSAYGCVPCSYFLHKTCVELIPTVNHHFHPLHPLTLSPRPYGWNCNVCHKQGFRKGFSYKCSECNFDACLKCGAAIALKEELSIKFKHEGHPQHALTLLSRSATINCDACHTKDEDFFYQCDDCDFWIHKSCTSLAPTIELPLHHHPLHLVYSSPDTFRNFGYHCEFCRKYIPKNSIWLYHCANCRYFVHIKCALNAEHLSSPRNDRGDTSSDGEDYLNDMLHFPMSYVFTDPLKLLDSKKIAQDNDETTEINHWSHHHPLILNVAPQGNNMNSGADPIEVCYGCVRPLSCPYYTCKDGCSFTLHKYCAHLSLTLEHQLHPDHPIHLVAITPGYHWQCYSCSNWGNMFAYKCETCNFYLDVNCAFLPTSIKHESHNHLLSQVVNPRLVCKGCDRGTNGISCYACEACYFHLCMLCAIRSPRSLTHRNCEGHEILLTYPPVEDHPEDFYCDICEKEVHPKLPLYYCHKCRRSYHLYCLSRTDKFENTWRKGTTTESYHKHALTFVRRIKKTPRYVCSKCNGDINGFLILECRAEACNFNICVKCHYKIYDS